MIMMNKGRWLAGFFLLVLIACTGPVQAAAVTVFSDDFNDNSLDTSKWTADVVGTNNVFREQNQRAEFQTYGPAGGGYHCYLNSKPILVDDWESIEITGRWTNTGYTSRTHIVKITNLDIPANFVSVEYSAWGSIMFYYTIEHPDDNPLNPPPSQTVSRPPINTLVPFRLFITKTGIEYYENNELLESIATTSMVNSQQFQLQIGAWEYSSITSNTYIDDIVVQANYPVVVLNDPVSVPEFPSVFLPVTFITGFAGAVLLIQRTKEH